MNYGYIRVSTDKQTTQNQRFEIQQYCVNENLPIQGWIQETISGTRSYDKRAVGKLLKKVKPGDLIICTELSRLGCPQGFSPAIDRLDDESDTIYQLMAEGMPKTEIARRFHVSRRTLYNWLGKGL